MASKKIRKTGAKAKDLPARNVVATDSKNVRGGRDAASGLPTGKRMHKPTVS